MQPVEDGLSVLATGRTNDLFADDMLRSRQAIAEQLDGKRLLVIGGAGSIGTATVHALAEFQPAAIHVVDVNENGLAELLRELRNGKRGMSIRDFRVLPLDFGAPLMRRFLRAQDPYHYVLNFAAVKHVRSEKDVPSVLHMLDTNVLRQADLLEWLGDRGGMQRYFSVSTDKAANPVNLMGASKRLMEHVIFSSAARAGVTGTVTSARFANVAFSNGSLLQSFLLRLARRQPLAVPRATRRYFVSLSEAAQVCLLATFCTPDQHVVVPRLLSETDAQDLESIAARVLHYHGFQPRIYEDEDAARENVDADVASGRYPLLLTPLDTVGEKPYEEFVSAGEQAVDFHMLTLLAIKYQGVDCAVLDELLDNLRMLVSSPDVPVTKQQIVASLVDVIPEFHHADTGKHLDDRL